MVESQFLYNSLNDGVLNERLRSFHRNLSLNKSRIEKSGGLRPLIPVFKDKNVIVVGAGPSLEEELDFLKKYQKDRSLLIISTDMALKPLIGRGIQPHFVISCETTPVDFFGGVNTERMHLLAFSCMSHINLERWKGSVSFYNWLLEGPEYSELWELSGTGLGFLATGSIVTTQAVSFAMGCNIKSLLLAGNDLAFKSQYYLRGSEHHNRFLHMQTRLTPGVSGEKRVMRSRREYVLERNGIQYFTDNQFLAAKKWLEELFSGKSIPVFDASSPGCSEQYTCKTTIKEFCSRYCTQKSRKKRRRV